MLSTLTNGLAGGACLSIACYGHLRQFGQRANTWTLLRAMFLNDQLVSTPEMVISPASRQMAFASGMLLSGNLLMESHFGQIGLSLDGNLHPVAGVLVASGVLIGAGSQLARGSLLVHALQGVSLGSSILPASTMIVAAVSTSFLAQSIPGLYLNSAMARHSLDAAAIYDGPSMVALTAVCLLGLAIKNQKSSKLSLRPTAAAFGSGAGIGMGVGLIGLCNTDQILSTLSFSAMPSPSLLLGIGSILALNRVLLLKTSSSHPSATSPSSSNATICMGSAMCGIGIGLTGIAPASAMVGVCSGSASFWVASVAMLGGAGSIYIVDALRMAYRKRLRPVSPP